MLLSLVPEKIDQTLLDLTLSPERWTETRIIMTQMCMLDKHNGFVGECDNIKPPSEEHNGSLLKLIALLNRMRMFGNIQQIKFAIRELLTLRDTVRDYKRSDLHSLFFEL